MIVTNWTTVIRLGMDGTESVKLVEEDLNGGIISVDYHYKYV